MKRLLVSKLFSVLFCAQFALAACNSGNNSGSDTTSTDLNTTDSISSTGMDTSMQGKAVATLAGTKPDTSVTGTVQFEQMQGGKVKMILDITVPKKANQSVAVHFHEHADCGDMGKHAGGHWNPTNVNHGKWGSNAFHSGDIGNIDLDANGKAKMELESDLWSIGGDPKKDILNKTVIVHSGVDDYTSQPSGNSGERIGCGLIQKQ